MVMASVFEEQSESLSDSYLDQLLRRQEFWAIAAISGQEVLGGLTAHTLPTTRAASSEVFIYDIAVRPDAQRQGIGRRSVGALRKQTSTLGIRELFVPADNEDQLACDFYRALGGTATPVTIFSFSSENA